MKKILFALGNREIEDELYKRLHSDYKIAGAVLRKGQILNSISDLKPDILILSENLDGNENIRDIVMKIRMDHAYVRIIFLSHRQVGDMLLSLLVTYGVYDIICGGSVKLGDIVGLVYSKNDYKDVHHLQPNVIFDELNVPHFKMPEVVNIERKNVVVKPSSQSAEATEKVRKEIEQELMVKMKSKLKEEFNKDYQILMQKGQMKEKEIKQRLESEYRNKMLTTQEAIRKQAELELSKKVNSEVNRAKLKMEEKLKERESLLRSEMESKIKDVLKQNAELKSKYEAEEYENSIRVKLEEELRQQLQKEKEEAEKIRAEEFELAKQKELANIKKQLLNQMETDGKRVLIQKEKELKKEIEHRKNLELKSELERLEKEKKDEIAKEKSILEKQKIDEIANIRKDLEKKKVEELKVYEEKIKEKEESLKSKLEKEMEIKAAKEIEKAKSAMMNNLKSRESKLREEMEIKIKDVLKQNAELKSKYEAEEYESQIRAKLEEKLRQQLQKEKEQADNERLKKERQKEEELNRKKAALIEKLKNESKKELDKKIKELEDRSADNLNAQLKRLESEKEREVEGLKKSLEEKIANKMNKLEQDKQEELRRLELQKQEEIKRLEAQRKSDLNKLKEQKDKEKQEELRRLELQKQEEMRKLEAQREEDLRKIKIQKDKERQEELRRLELQKQEEMKRFEAQMNMEKEEFIKAESQFVMKNNQKIVSFLGGKNGVGTTTVAINVASALAMQGKKVLFVELNAETPAIGYWYRFDIEIGGLEAALKAVQNGRYSDIDENMIKSTKLKKSEYGRLYKNFPDTLDFLLFSQQETLLKKSRVEFDRGDLKELYFYLMQHAGYEYLVVDLRIDESDEWAAGSMLFSSKTYSVVNQDVSSLAYVNYRIDRLERMNIPLSRKNSYIVNRLDERNCKLKLREIEGWLDGEKVLKCPDMPGDVMNSIYDGEPLILKTRNKEFKKAINAIVEDITGNKKGGR